MFVSRKCLAALIHLFACKFSTRVYVAQFVHQRAILLYPGLPSCNHFQPVPKKLMQRSVLALRFLSGQLDVGLVGVKSNILSHEHSVHHSRALGQTVSLATVLPQTQLASPVLPCKISSDPCPPSTSGSRKRPGSSPTTLHLRFSGSRRLSESPSRN